MLDIILDIVFNIIAFTLGWFAHKRAIRHDYRWACDEEGCTFGCSSNYWEGVMKLADAHKRGAHNA